VYRLRTVKSFSWKGNLKGECAAASSSFAASSSERVVFWVFGEGSRKPEVGYPGFDDDAVCADDDYDADHDDADKSGGAGNADDGENSSMRVKC
jgi:hypothetical protein